MEWIRSKILCEYVNFMEYEDVCFLSEVTKMMDNVSVNALWE